MPAAVAWRNANGIGPSCQVAAVHGQRVVAAVGGAVVGPGQAGGHPVLAKLVSTEASSGSRPWLARHMAEAIVGVPPGRPSMWSPTPAGAGVELTRLLPGVAWTARPRNDVVLCVAGHRAQAPWCHGKTRPSTADMTAKPSASPVAARFPASRPTGRPAKESTSYAWSGKTSQHNRESRALYALGRNDELEMGAAEAYRDLLP